MEKILILLNIVMAYLGIPMIIKMFKENEIIALNYKEEKTPICLGIIFILVEIVSISIYLIFKEDIEVLLFLLALCIVGFIGLLDDFTGDIEVKGLKGHIKSFFNKNLTTGFIKAAIGFYIALFLSIKTSYTLRDIILNTFIIALSINLMNLFDLRPGRCLKIFNFLALIFLLLAGFEKNFIILSIVAISMVYFPYDIKAKSMMGDVGSNVLGLTLGYYCILTQSMTVRVVFLVSLIIVHILAEKYSISEFIKKNKVLNYIDNLGR